MIIPECYPTLWSTLLTLRSDIFCVSPKTIDILISINMKRKQQKEKEETIKCNYLESATWILPMFNSICTIISIQDNIIHEKRRQFKEGQLFLHDIRSCYFVW